MKLQHALQSSHSRPLNFHPIERYATPPIANDDTAQDLMTNPSYLATTFYFIFNMHIFPGENLSSRSFFRAISLGLGEVAGNITY